VSVLSGILVLPYDMHEMHTKLGHTECYGECKKKHGHSEAEEEGVLCNKGGQHRCEYLFFVDLYGPSKSYCATFWSKTAYCIICMMFGRWWAVNEDCT